MNITAGWAPVVHGRTLHADFSDNLLAVPREIWETRTAGPTSGYAWLRSVVGRAIANASKMDRRKLLLSGVVATDKAQAGDVARWIVAKSGTVCLFGVACMAYDINPTTKLPSRSDGYLGEDIPVFLGYAALVNPAKYPAPLHHPPFPTLDELRKPGFASVRALFKFVTDKWDDFGHKASDPPAITDASMMPPEFVGQVRRDNDGVDSLTPDYPNADHIRAWTWTDGPKIWTAAANETRFPVTLCIGVADEQDAERLRFQNVVYRVGSNSGYVIPSEGEKLVVKREVLPTEPSPVRSNSKRTEEAPSKPRNSAVTLDQTPKSSLTPSHTPDNRGQAKGLLATGLGAVAGLAAKAAGANWAVAVGVGGAIAAGTLYVVRSAERTLSSPADNHDNRNEQRADPPIAKTASPVTAVEDNAATALSRATEAHKRQAQSIDVEPPADEASVKKKPKW